MDEVPIGDGRLSEFDVINLSHDPGKRRKISDFHPDDRDIVRREYIQKQPCQPGNHEFPQTNISGKNHRFNPNWFQKHESWLEYSVEKDTAFCFVCYLFKDDNTAGEDAFISSGFRAWNIIDAFVKHVGGHMSAHNQALRRLNDFKNQKTSISSSFSKQSDESTNAYHLRLEASITCLKWLLLQGLAFRGHDESEKSLNKGNFLELLQLLSVHNPEYKKVVLKNAPGNCQLIAPSIQKDIVNACAKETTKAIVEELGDGFFSILVDESADISDKEQMALCLRYVNKKGEVQERFLGILRVNTTSLTLKAAIESLLMEHSLSLSSVRGQGYDGASNMRGSINGLKTLILNESPSAYYVHCFAHQLQLTLAAVAQKNRDVSWLFGDVIAPLLNFVGGSPKRKEFLQEKQAENVVEALSLGQLESGSGLNQELGLSRPGDTHWGSYFKTILNVISLYPTILESLDAIAEVSDWNDTNNVESLTHLMMSFDFIFVAHLMLSIFGITNELNLALQRKEQDIVNAMSMVDVTKANLQDLRDNGWNDLMEKVTSFMIKHEVKIPDMEANYVIRGMSRYHGSKQPEVTNLHHFRVEVFLCVIDLQLQELENRFSEVSKELLVCMSCFHPSNRFSSFDKKKLLRLAQFYPREFSETELLFFEYSLGNFIADIRNDERFWDVKNLNELSIKLVETKKHEIHSRVYLLLKLVLLLPVATSTVERAFSAMTIVKNKLRNSMGDQLLNDCLVTFIEKDLFVNVSIDAIVRRYQNMRTRREQL